MYKVEQDIEKNLVTIEVAGEVDPSMARHLLDDLNNGRKLFKSGYSTLIKLGKDIDFIDSMFAAMDLTAFKAKMAKVRKIGIQVPKGNLRSKETAEKLMALYQRSDIKTQVTESQFETNKWLGL
jgi:hypothetical protein